MIIFLSIHLIPQKRLDNITDINILLLFFIVFLHCLWSHFL